jgi:hypothetical protein
VIVLLTQTPLEFKTDTPNGAGTLQNDANSGPPIAKSEKP